PSLNPPGPRSSSGGRGPPGFRGSARYHGSTTAGQWLDRIVAHGLGTRSRAELTLTDRGVHVVRPGARDFFIPAAQLRGARLDKGIAGKVLAEGGLLVITWQLGEKLIDSGFRSDHAVEHPAWVDALSSADNDQNHPSNQTEGAER
ncbi:PH-like domain-containing protein, partial [Streptomyces malaysiensis]|uniref:PH-like domain-containing protein n=1 Tax=Streptomyces malaysiensis TaxID=92644 RepID=UPI00369CC82E